MGGLLVQAIRLLVEMSVGAIVYAATALVLRVPEMRLVLDFGGRVVRRLPVRVL